jgi:NTE family protein
LKSRGPDSGGWFRSWSKPSWRPAAILLALVAAQFAGCSHRPINQPLRSVRGEDGYYFHTQQRPDNSDDMLFIVALSGGGTRAAALAYGVLEELAETRFQTPDGPRRLVDEVDGISAVSGGSVTAAAYGLYGDGIFPRLEGSFLKRNVQDSLLLRTLNPIRWPSLWSGRYGRSEVAAEYYDEILFKGATLGDIHRRPGPFVVINATDITTGARFEFTQYQFDLLCSDVSTFPVSQAVAASSAVPAVLTPVTVNNYGGQCGNEPPGWILPTTNVYPSRVRMRARELRSYLDSTNRPFIHLVDGGVSDNLGLRAVLDAMLALQANPAYAERFDLGRVKKLVVLSAYAYSAPEKDWDRRESPPGSLITGAAAASHTLDRFSFETLELIRSEFERLQRIQGEDSGVKLYPVFVNFTNFTNPEERNFFLNIPTSFFLPNNDVDRIRDAGHRLLRQNHVYRELLTDLGIPLPDTTPDPGFIRDADR